MTQYGSWGRYPNLAPAAVSRPHWRDEPLPDTASPMLAYGNGRSYGDSCLNDHGVLRDMRGLDRLIAFDPATGILRCESGVLLADILRFAVPRGWFPAVTPGTRFVTIGGAIANDVHGKNHHRTGTFGQHVLRFALQRSDHTTLLCAPDENPGLFGATIGGLGLTGVILWAEIQLRRIANTAMATETIRFPDIDAFFDLSHESDQDYEYTVAWIDCLAKGASLGRGLFLRGNHATAQDKPPPGPGRVFGFPTELPFPLVNAVTLRAFNQLHYHRQRAQSQRKLMHYEPFFYPLDGIRNWNRLYGRNGFLQYQCVVPPETAKPSIRALLEATAAAGTGSFLAVLKNFGQHPAAGLLSFARPGTTFALDFPNRGQPTLDLLAQLDRITAAAGGAVYPAKDARMSAPHFQQYFPRWREFQNYIDPNFSSSFWRRVSRTA